MRASKEPITADLHLHTTASDGLWDAGETVRRAQAQGCTLIAITDHDTVDAVEAAVAEGARTGLRVLSGIELTCGHGEEVHVLGYGFDPRSPALTAFLDARMASRRARILAMLEKLCQLGMPIAPEETGSAGARFMGRMNLAQAMADHGYVASAEEAFAKYLNPGMAAYVPGKRVTVSESAQVLSASGAMVVLAHPGRLAMDPGNLSALLPEWQAAGLAGIEAYHASHDAQTALQYDRMARRLGLLVTGGSDSHGRPGGAKIGDHWPMWRTMQEDMAALMRRMH